MTTPQDHYLREEPIASDAAGRRGPLQADFPDFRRNSYRRSVLSRPCYVGVLGIASSIALTVLVFQAIYVWILDHGIALSPC